MSAVEPVSLWQPHAVCTHSWGWPTGTVPQHCIHGTSRVCVHWAARSQRVICDRHLCLLAQDSARVLLGIPAAAPGQPSPLKFVEDKAWNRVLLPPLWIFSQIADVMVCIYCNVFLQINLALK